MRIGYFLILGGLLVTPITASVAQSRPFQLIPTDDVGRLTVTEAERLVARSLLETGQRMVRVDRANYTGNGSVVVDVVTAQGTLFRQVLVDSKTHHIVAPLASG